MRQVAHSITKGELYKNVFTDAKLKSPLCEKPAIYPRFLFWTTQNDSVLILYPEALGYSVLFSGYSLLIQANCLQCLYIMVSRSYPDLFGSN